MRYLKFVCIAGNLNFQFQKTFGADEESKIDDASDDEPDEIIASNTITGNNLSNERLGSKDVLNCESDIDDISENDDSNRNESISKPDSDGSDCEAIHCKKIKISRLDFINSKSPGSAHRISDDLFIVSNAIELMKNKEKCSNLVKLANVTEDKDAHETSNTAMLGVRNCWNILNDTFKTRDSRTACKKTPNRSWKSFDDSFGSNTNVEIKCAETQTNTILPNTEENTIIENIPESEVTYTDSNVNYKSSYLQQPARLKCTKNSPFNHLRIALHEKISRQNFWLHERQMGLVAGRRSVKVDSIHNIFNRVAISYSDNDDCEIQHVIYLDPAEKVLRSLVAGSSIEVEYDIEPHKVSHRKFIHLGVCKIKAID